MREIERQGGGCSTWIRELRLPVGTTFKANRFRHSPEIPSEDATQQCVTDEKQVAVRGEAQPIKPGQFYRVEHLPITIEQRPISDLGAVADPEDWRVSLRACGVQKTGPRPQSNSTSALARSRCR